MCMQEAVATSHNQFAYSVSEISQALKRVVEDNFGHVRVRGEISGWKVAASGHAYLKLKDDNAVIDAVCWKGVLSKMPFKPEDGIEITCSGKLTTYPGRSNYQLVIDYMEPAGVGALMALLEKRKKQLAAEGLFDPARKKPLPFMPKVIGVVTSPTGAVIRDILHRLSDRFPVQVLVWPVLVQGEGAAQQIANAINGFNLLGGTLPPSALRADSPAGSSQSAPPPRPDLIIVARGGGSLEDLWSFNEEIVVRAAAASQIPLISAVGHETDTTLIDYASDMRAPTPTAAAELAVPVREEWLATIMEEGRRHMLAMKRYLQQRGETITGLARGLPQPAQVLQMNVQKLDDRAERLHAALPALLISRTQQLQVASAKLQPRSLLTNLQRNAKDVASLNERAGRMMQRVVEDKNRKLESLTQVMQSLNPTRVLERGFALVRGADGRLVTRAAALQQGEVTLVFADGEKKVKA